MVAEGADSGELMHAAVGLRDWEGGCVLTAAVTQTKVCRISMCLHILNFSFLFFCMCVNDQTDRSRIRAVD